MLALLLASKIEDIAKSLSILSQRERAGKTEKWDNIKAWDIPTMSEAILYGQSYIQKLESINSAKNKSVIRPKF